MNHLAWVMLCGGVNEAYLFLLPCSDQCEMHFIHCVRVDLSVLGGKKNRVALR